jgi:hypothetical protein
MKDHEGCIRGYHRSSKAWYAKANNKDRIEVSFGMYAEERGTSGEMTMEWVELSGKQRARLKCFEDCWSALALFTDLIQKMGEVDSEEIQEEEFVKMLDECGFKDMTAYKDPYVEVETPKEDQESFLKQKETDRLKIGDEIDLDMGEGKIEKVTVSKITPHPEVRGSVYYEFSNGVVCRDIRLH